MDDLIQSYLSETQRRGFLDGAIILSRFKEFKELKRIEKIFKDFEDEQERKILALEDIEEKRSKVSADIDQKTKTLLITKEKTERQRRLVLEASSTKGIEDLNIFTKELIRLTDDLKILKEQMIALMYEYRRLEYEIVLYNHDLSIGDPFEYDQ